MNYDHYTTSSQFNKNNHNSVRNRELLRCVNIISHPEFYVHSGQQGAEWGYHALTGAQCYREKRRKWLWDSEGWILNCAYIIGGHIGKTSMVQEDWSQILKRKQSITYL